MQGLAGAEPVLVPLLVCHALLERCRPVRCSTRRANSSFKAELKQCIQGQAFEGGFPV